MKMYLKSGNIPNIPPMSKKTAIQADSKFVIGNSKESQGGWCKYLVTTDHDSRQFQQFSLSDGYTICRHCMRLTGIVTDVKWKPEQEGIGDEFSEKQGK